MTGNCKQGNLYKSAAPVMTYRTVTVKQKKRGEYHAGISSPVQITTNVNRIQHSVLNPAILYTSKLETGQASGCEIIIQHTKKRRRGYLYS